MLTNPRHHSKMDGDSLSLEGFTTFATMRHGLRNKHSYKRIVNIQCQKFDKGHILMHLEDLVTDVSSI